MNLLKLIRLPNLIMIVLSQYAIRYLIIESILKISGFELQFPNFYFALLVLSTVLIAAAGYIINDYFDKQTDEINKPNKLIIDKFISRRVAIFLHITFNVIAIFIGSYLAFEVKFYSLILIFVFTPGLLWYYSTTYKKIAFLGNFIVAFLTALVPFLVILFEMPLLTQKYHQILIDYNMNFNVVFYWVLAFSFFAFLTNLIREVIKDLQDIEGDLVVNKKTLPTKIGIKTSKILVVSLIVIELAILAIAYFNNKILREDISFWYLLITIILPSIFVIYLIAEAKFSKDYKLASILMKIIIFCGINYGWIFYIMF